MFLYICCFIICGRILLLLHVIVGGMIFPVIDCFGLQELFEGWGAIEFHQIEQCMLVFLEIKYGDYIHTGDTTV